MSYRTRRMGVGCYGTRIMGGVMEPGEWGVWGVIKPGEWGEL